MPASKPPASGQSSEGAPAEPTPLSKTEVRNLVLELVEAKPGIQESELAAELQDRTGQPEPALLKLFRKMEQKGLLERGSQGGREILSLPGAADKEPTEEAAPPPAPAETPPSPRPPPEREEPSAPRGRIVLRSLVLAVLVGVAVVAVVLATRDDGSPQRPAGEGKQDPAPREKSAARERSGSKEPEPESRPSPSAVALTKAKRAKTAVLSGSAEPGIAAKTGEQLKRKGFKVATVGNASGPSRRSQVLYAKASQRALARALARSLGIEATKPLDPVNAALAPGARLVVLVGADRER